MLALRPLTTTFRRKRSRHFGYGDAQRAQLPLRLLHPEGILSRVKLDQFRRLSTAELIGSLALGNPGALKARPDGTVLDGHHRIVVRASAESVSICFRAKWCLAKEGE